MGLHSTWVLRGALLVALATTGGALRPRLHFGVRGVASTRTRPLQPLVETRLFPEVVKPGTAGQELRVSATNVAEEEPKEPSTARDQFVSWLLRYRKWLILTALVAQNAGTALLTGAARERGAVYSPAGISLMQELAKGPLVILAIMLFGGRLQEVRTTFRKAANARSLLELSVPAACYSAQNVLYFVALANLNPAIYQLLSQSKTLFTAIFVVTLLKRTLLQRQWLSLLLLATGVGAVQVSQSASGAIAGNVVLGISAVLASSVLSGFANVYFERIVKRPDDDSLWVRQLQLNFLTAICTVAEVARRGELTGVLNPATYAGWTSLVWTIVFAKSVGGLLVGGTVKYADNILKSFATAVAIGVTCAFSKTVFSPAFGMGLTLVLASIYLYNPNLPVRWGKKAEKEETKADLAIKTA